MDMRPLQSGLYQGSITGRKGRMGANSMVIQLGSWLFRNRTAIPVPIVLALLVLPPTSSSVWLIRAGMATIAAGELVRLLAVRQIGAISRTRTDRLGPLVAAGPFGLVRNPLYLGNIALWLGFAMTARIPWLVMPVGLLLALEYHAIVRWEEHLLEQRLGERYRAYAAVVPRWIPRFRAAAVNGVAVPRAAFTWGETLYSERGTLIAISAGLALLWLKTRAF